MSRNQPTEPSKLRRYILWGCFIIALLVLNYWYLNKFLSSNSNYITAYTPMEDDLAQYRNPAVAGLFYSAQPGVLSSQVDEYLQSGRFVKHIGYQPKIIIVPHAGYSYSAGTAAKAYTILQKYADNIKNVILLGPAHYYDGKEAYLSNVDYFSTPLGNVAVNKDVVAQISQNCSDIIINNKAHDKEHSLEVQLPFLQKVLPQAKIVPIVYGNVNPQKLSACIQNFLKDKNTILVVSADLSHYHSYDEAQKIDTNTAADIAQGNQIKSHASCGAIGINSALLLAAENNYRPQMLALTNSGDVGGDKSRVVGYGAWSFYSDHDSPKTLSPLEQEVISLKTFSELYGKFLLQIARNSVEKAVKHHKSYSPSRSSFPEDLFDKGASFVTLRKNNELRGCIGSILPNASIAQDVSSNAYAAALEDSRFSPISETELPQLNYSISLLSGFEKIQYNNESDLLDKIQPKIDGIVIRDGNRQGVFLPSVWNELPKKSDFFKQLKIKAGINPNYWNNRIKVYRFRTVEIKDEN